MKRILKNKLNFLDENPRHKALFLLLLRNDRYITSEELAQQLEVTSRTIKSDLKYIKDNIDFSEIEIVSKKSRGNKILIKDEEVKREVIKYYQIFQTYTYDSDFEKRVYYIARRLLSSDKPVRIDDFQNELYFNSNYIFNKELTTIREMLSYYNLELKMIPKKGMVINGNKFNRCLAMIKMYRYFNQYTDLEFKIKKYSDLFEPSFLSKETIRLIICDCILKTRIVFSDIHMERFILFFILLTKYKFDESDISENMRNLEFDYRITDEYELITTICNKFKSLKVEYDFDNEIFVRFLTYMAIMSTDLYRYKDCSTEKYGHLVEISKTIRNEILNEFEEWFHVSPFCYETILKDLVKILIPISMKIKLGISDDIDSGYYAINYDVNKPVISKFINHIVKRITEKYKYTLSNREKHIMLNVLYEFINNIHLEHKKINIALIAIDGRINTQQIKFTLKNYFSHYINSLDTKVIYELDKIETNKYDVFICMEYGKNMSIPYKPLVFFKEGLSDYEYFKLMQDMFSSLDDHNAILPEVEYELIDSSYKLTEFPIYKYKNMSKKYISIYLGKNNEILVNMCLDNENESIKFFYYDMDGMDTQGKRIYVLINININYNVQKFKILLDFVSNIAENSLHINENKSFNTYNLKFINES